MTYRQLTIPSSIDDEKNLRALMLVDRRVLSRHERSLERGSVPDQSELESRRIVQKRRMLPRERVGHTPETKAKIAAAAKAIWQQRLSHQPDEAVSPVDSTPPEDTENG
jgi:hypothetical protein